MYAGGNPVNAIDPTGLDHFLILVSDEVDSYAAHARAEELRNTEDETPEGDKKYHTANVVYVSNPKEMEAAILAEDKIDGGLIWYGHANKKELILKEGKLKKHKRRILKSPEEKKSKSTRLTFKGVEKLAKATRHKLGDDAFIELNGCNTNKNTKGDSISDKFKKEFKKNDVGGWTDYIEPSWKTDPCYWEDGKKICPPTKWDYETEGDFDWAY